VGKLITKNIVFKILVLLILSFNSFADNNTDWTGCYLGADLNKQEASWWSHDAPNANFNNPSWDSYQKTTEFDINNVGIHFGCGKQINYFYYGGEISYAAGNHKETHVQVGNDPLYLRSADIDEMITLKGSFGIPVNRFLFHIDIGRVYADTEFSDAIDSTDLGLGVNRFNEIEKTMNGWLYGIGTKYKINDKFSLSVNYSYTNFGDVFQAIPSSNTEFGNELTIRGFKFGASYHF